MKKAFSLLIALLLCIFPLIVPAHAESVRIDAAKPSSLTVKFQVEGNKVIPDATFHIYRIGYVDEDGKIYAMDPYAQYPVVITDVDNDGNAGAALAMKGFVLAEGLEPDASAVTDRNGVCVFENLPAGIYLVFADACQNGGRVYFAQAALVRLPGKMLGGEWNYDVNIIPKYDSREAGGPPIERRVIKIWDNENRLHTGRPHRIDLVLLKDGEIYDRVKINARNSWRYTWEDLESDSDWTVAELPAPEGYTVSVSQEGVTFKITNTAIDESTPVIPLVAFIPIIPLIPLIPIIPLIPVVPFAVITLVTIPLVIPAIATLDVITDGDITPPGPGGNVPGPADNTPDDGITPNDSEKLPQTGQLWWPVPILSVLGLLLLVYGIDRRRKERENET